MQNLTATYSPDDNKLRLYSGARLDSETYARVSDAGFRFAPKQDLFVAPMWTPAREDLLLELCGEIGDEDSSLVDRAEDRADRFGDYSAHRGAEAVSARQQAVTIADGIPFGQPILVGHHSERRARKDAERIENGMRRAVQLWDTSEYWRHRAAGALRHAQYKERPDVRHRRIKGIEADMRKAQRSLEDIQAATVALTAAGLTYEQAMATASTNRAIYGLWSTLEKQPQDWQALCAQTVTRLQTAKAHYDRWIAHYQNRVTYERAMLDEQGGVASDRFDIQAGGSVLVDGEWLAVLRVNKTGGSVNSVTTVAPAAAHWRKTWKYGIEKVKDYRAPSAEQAASQKAAAKLPPLCNYPGDGFLHITKAEWDRTHKDYKGSRELGQGAQRPGGYRPDIKGAAALAGAYGRHRVRSIVRGGALEAVYLTDSKRSDPPAPAAEPVAAEPIKREYAEPAPAPHHEPCSTSDQAAEFNALREQLREGVAVVAAPQLFPTPAPLAARMVEMAEIEPGMRVLEPSAGTGRILSAVRAVAGSSIRTAVEINSHLSGALRRLDPGAYVFNTDFLQWAGGTAGTYDRIVMNPPFENAQDIAHIQHALGMLKPGGVLVALCANGPRQQAQLRPIVEQHGGSWEELPADTFAAAGTNVRTALLCLTR